MGSIGNKLRKVRLSQNLSQERFGKKVGISGKTISAYETGKAEPSFRVLESISQTYKVEFVHARTDKWKVLVRKLNEAKSVLSEIENSLKESLSL